MARIRNKMERLVVMLPRELLDVVHTPAQLAVVVSALDGETDTAAVARRWGFDQETADEVALSLVRIGVLSGDRHGA